VSIIDNGDAGFETIGDWTHALNPSAGGYENDVHYSANGSGSDVATWTFDALTAGQYQVAATWSTHPNRATDSPFTVFDGTTELGSLDVNQESPPDDFSDQGANWDILGVFDIAGDTLVVRLSDDANEYVIADAVRIEWLGELPSGQSALGGTILLETQTDQIPNTQGPDQRGSANLGNETAAGEEAALHTGSGRTSMLQLRQGLWRSSNRSWIETAISTLTDTNASEENQTIDLLMRMEEFWFN
jgi:hypothetical protein